MNYLIGIKRKIVYVMILFIVIYGCIASLYVYVSKKQFTNQIQVHSDIVAHDVWYLNSSGMKAYLQLVAKTENYKELNVIIGEAEIFISVTSPPITGIEKILYDLNLISLKEFTSPIEYEDQTVGTIRGFKYLRFIFPLSTIFIFQFFTFLTIIFIFYLLFYRRFLEKEVQDRTRKYHELVNLLPEMVLETDKKDRVIYANKMAIEKFGFDDPSIYQQSLENLIEIDSINREKVQLGNFLLGSDLKSLQFRANNNTGTSFPVLVRAAPILEDDQRVGARIVLVDITERSILEEQLNRDQKMKFIGMMAGGVAHDLNNILSGIINYPEIILQKFPNEKGLRKLVEPMKAAGLRAAAIVADLLMIARGVATPRIIANLDDIIEDYTKSPELENLESLYSEFSYQLDLNSQGQNISCSNIHIRKCLMNLVVNGVEAMSGNGCITIATSTMQTDGMETRYGKITPGSYAVLSIADTGSGIATKDLEHIFEPFYSTKRMGRSGTGLGLAIVWNIMQDHNGGVDVQTGENGTVFHLYFPLSNDVVRTDKIKSIDQDYSGNGEKILIIDDELQQRDIALQLLQSLGYQTSTVSSGEEAITYLQENRVDILLLDMVIGPGINGKVTYERALQLSPGQKAIIISGYSESDDVKATIKLGAGKLINKPYTKEKLAKTVYQELKR